MDDETLEIVTKLENAFLKYEETCKSEGIGSDDTLACEKKAAEIIDSFGSRNYSLLGLHYLELFFDLKLFFIGKSPLFKTFYDVAADRKVFPPY